MTRRINLEIMAEILGLCTNPQTKTRIMYKTNLSHRGLERYLHQLLSLGLLELHRSIPQYTTTKKGFDFLEKWTRLVELLHPRLSASTTTQRGVHPANE